MASQKPLVLTLGMTSTTGKIITNAFLTSGNFCMAAIIPPSSLIKPVVSDFCACGIKILTGDLNDGAKSLKNTLSGMDIIINSIIAWAISQ